MEISSKNLVQITLTNITQEQFDKFFNWQHENGIYPIQVPYSRGDVSIQIYTPQDANKVMIFLQILNDKK